MSEGIAAWRSAARSMRRASAHGPRHRGQISVVRHAFDVLGVNCVQIRTDFLNQASRRAIERLGRWMDGVLRGHLILEGHMRDSVVYRSSRMNGRRPPATSNC